MCKLSHNQVVQSNALSVNGTVQDLLGHKDVSTSQIYTYVMVKPGMGVKSPLDL